MLVHRLGRSFPSNMFYVEVRERMCQTFFPPVIRYKVGLSHFIDIVLLFYNKEGIAPDFESSDCQLPSQLHSHNQRLILRNVVGTPFEESERMREKMPFWCDENNADT